MVRLSNGIRAAKEERIAAKERVRVMVQDRSTQSRSQNEGTQKAGRQHSNVQEHATARGMAAEGPGKGPSQKSNSGWITGLVVVSQ